MLTITEVQTKILEALNRYKFLTHSQMKELGIGNLQFLRSSTKHLCCFPNEKKPLVGAIKFPIAARAGKIENVHYLTEAGAQVLADILSIDYSELDFQKVTSVYHRDYWHRRYCIDFHIRLTQTLAGSQTIELSTFDRYFDKIGANRRKRGGQPLRSKTRVDFGSPDLYIIPDVNFILQAVGNPEKKALFCFEMTNGRDTKRILTQIYKHTLAMQNGAMAAKYGVQRQDYITLFLFSEASLMKAVRERFSEIRDAAAFERCFFFGHLEEMGKEVLKCWKRVKGEERWNFVTGKKTPT